MHHIVAFSVNQYTLCHSVYIILVEIFIYYFVRTNRSKRSDQTVVIESGFCFEKVQERLTRRGA